VTFADDMKQDLRNRALAASTLAMAEIRQQLREDTPKRTGRTSRGWYATGPVLDGDGVSFTLSHPQGPDDPPDVEWLNSGTRAHPISARQATFLAFPGQYALGVSARFTPSRTGGEIVFVKSVMHPGTTGTGFIDRIMGQDNVDDVVARAFQATQ
jgi:hypothetical protein